MPSTPPAELRPPADEIARKLEHLAADVRAGRPLTAAEERYVLGLVRSSPAARLAERDDLIRVLGDMLGGASVNARAMAVQGELRSYASIGWPLDRRRGAPYPATDRRKVLYALFMLDDDPPQSRRQLITILS